MGASHFEFVMRVFDVISTPSMGMQLVLDGPAPREAATGFGYGSCEEREIEDLAHHIRNRAWVTV
ncbi:hypothetical protein DBR33_01165 [Stenotrophomonas sp. HMWF022]|nr:hypothetical protein DBR20_12755 [Stenotrophomonas sp. HMWF023]PTT57981.1 hypothetical protein DBR33_01165 [Stenotrophomonas sp. HMWF022]